MNFYRIPTGEPEVPVLHDLEVEKLCDSTNWKSPYEAQRTNLPFFVFAVEDLCFAAAPQHFAALV